jgi:ferritin
MGEPEMLSQKIEEAFNKQINAELYSAYLYLSMAAYFESQNLEGMAQWMRKQAQEESEHAMKFFDFINERGGRVILTPIEGPKVEWSSPLEAFKDSYQHECKVTGLIHHLVELAQSEKDHAAGVFLHWFVNEQVEEEASVSSVVHKVEMIGERGGMLFMLDRELGRRGEE